MEISLIAALDEDNLIGRGGKIPWDIPEDMTHFRTVTMGNPLIMGRKTFESIIATTGGPLTDRRSIVLTSSPEKIEQYTHKNREEEINSLVNTTEVIPATSIEQALAFAHTDYSDIVYVIGGASVYKQFLPIADELLLTRIHNTYSGDTYFPDINWDNWEKTQTDSYENFSINTYRRAERTKNKNI